MKLTAIIVDDEIKLHEVLVELLRDNCPEIEIIGTATDIKEAYALILKLQPKAVFLDIEMPGGTGFDLLSKFDPIFFETIFVTSYGHYMLKALRLSALDYILKPILTDDLKTIPARLKEAIELKSNAFKYKMLQSNSVATEKEKRIAIPSKSKMDTVSLKDIIYLQAEDSYTKLFLSGGKKIVISRTLKDYEEMLCTDSQLFIRIHKSYIINISYLKYVNRGDDFSVILVNDIVLEVARRKKRALLDMLQLK